MKKILISIITAMMILPLCIRPVKADMGPKPAIYLEFEEKYGSEYYCVLMSNLERSGPNGPLNGTDDYGMGNLPEKLFDVLMEYSDADGCKPWNLIYNFNDNSSVSWTYYAPSVFKIALYKADGTLVAISKLVEKETFKGYFNCSVEGSTIRIKDNYNYRGEILKLAARMAITILVELVIGLIFGYRSKKQIITIIITNVITQLLLNILITVDTIYGGGFASMILMIPAEGVIMIIESIVYCLLFKQSKGKIIVYTIVANILTFLLTFTSLAL